MYTIKKEETWFYLCAALLFVFIALRSVFVPILQDEVSTFTIYVQSGNFIPWKAYPDANNHFLNSFGMWISYHLFGDSVWSLRLPNVLASILFLVSVIRLSRFMDNRMLRIGFVLSLFFAHGFTDFFAVARGYGMSMAFLLFTLWMIFEYANSRKLHCLSLAFLSLALAVMANLTLLPSVAIIIIYILMLRIINKDRKATIPENIFRVSFLILVVVYLIAIRYSLMLKGIGKLYYGGESGFFNAVLITQSLMLFLSSNIILIWCIVGLFGITLGVFLYLYFVKGFHQSFEPSFTLFPALLMGSLLSFILLHFLFKVNYPEDRASLFLYPYFVGFVFFTAQATGKKVMQYLVLPFIFVIINFATYANFEYAFHWRYERFPDSFPEIVAKTSGDISLGNITITGYKIYEQGWSYRVKNVAPGLNLINSANYPNNTDDYILLGIAEAERTPGYFDNYKTIGSDKHSKLKMMQRVPRLERRLLFEKTSIEKTIETSNEFISIQKDTIINCRNKSLIFGFDFRIDPTEEPLNATFVVTVWDSLHNALRYDRIELDWLSKKPLPDYSYSISLVNLPNEAYSVVAYILNKNKKPIRVHLAKVSVWEFVKN